MLVSVIKGMNCEFFCVVDAHLFQALVPLALFLLLCSECDGEDVAVLASLKKQAI